MDCLYIATRKKVHRLIQHHISLFACTLCHPPQGFQSPTRRRQRTRALLLKQSPAPRKKVTSFLAQESLQNIHQQGKKQETHNGREHPQHPSSLPPTPAVAHHCLWLQLCLQDLPLVAPNAGALWSGRQQQSTTCWANLKSHHKTSLTLKYLVGATWEWTNYKILTQATTPASCHAAKIHHLHCWGWTVHPRYLLPWPEAQLTQQLSCQQSPALISETANHLKHKHTHTVHWPP